MLNPLAYWPQDPNGWLRHLVVGLIMGLVVVKFKLNKYYLILAIAIAIGKEIFDEFMEWQDIVLTIGGTLFVKWIK